MPKKKTQLQKRKPKKITVLATKPKKRRRRYVVQRPKMADCIEVCDVLKHINTVQIDRKDVKITVEKDDAAVVENIMKDAGVLFTRDDKPQSVVYRISPGPEVEAGAHALDTLDELNDEIPEE